MSEPLASQADCAGMNEAELVKHAQAGDCGSGLAGDADVALAVCVAAMALRSVHRSEMSGVSIAAHARPVEDLPDMQEACAQRLGWMPDDEAAILDWALDLSRERLLGVLAVLVAASVDLAHEDASPTDVRKQAIADRLAVHLDIDMRKHWKPGLDFWLRLPKATLMNALADAPAMAERGVRAREEVFKAHAKLRKNDLADKVAALLADSDYLPDILVTPLTRGSLSVTAEGMDALAAPAVAAE